MSLLLSGYGLHTFNLLKSVGVEYITPLLYSNGYDYVAGDIAPSLPANKHYDILTFTNLDLYFTLIIPRDPWSPLSLFINQAHLKSSHSFTNLNDLVAFLMEQT